MSTLQNTRAKSTSPTAPDVAHGAVAQHGQEVAEAPGDQAPKYERKSGSTKLGAFAALLSGVAGQVGVALGGQDAVLAQNLLHLQRCC